MLSLVIKINDEQFEKYILKNSNLLSYLLTEDGIHDLKEGLIVHDCDMKVDREQPLAITTSKIKHIVHLLNMGNFFTPGKMHHSRSCSR